MTDERQTAKPTADVQQTHVVTVIKAITIERQGNWLAAKFGGKEAPIYMSDQLHLEAGAISQIQNLMSVSEIEKLAFMQDCHRGPGIPVGTVGYSECLYPALPGNDIGCGMRLDVTEFHEDNFDITPELRNRLRHAFFQGGREIFVPSRGELLAYGLEARIAGKSVERTQGMQHHAHQHGALGDGTVSTLFDDYTSVSGRDNFLATIGGGNHFVEVLAVDEIIDSKAAYRAGLRKGAICIMCHSGSLDFGQVVGNFFRDIAVKSWTGKHPDHGLFSLTADNAERYIQASYNAANFASVNRMTMAALVAEILNTSIRSVYDAPHNLIWSHRNGYLHRKGSCPADVGEIVIIPGSMGTRSAVALGKGFAGSMCSAPHGAGRVMNRNAGRTDDLIKVDVITKVDLDRVRSDVRAELMKSLNEEAPRVYKDIHQVVASVEQSGIADIVAWLRPILTLKG